MQITTWNVNSLGVRLPQVLQWLQANPVDALCLQELKLEDTKFPVAAFEEAGYHSAFFGQKTYNGVAIISRSALRDVSRNLPAFKDTQSRVLTATIDSATGPIRLINGYFVNGQALDSDKFVYKLAWLDALQAHVAAELAAHPRVVLLGDFNIVAEDRDSFDPVGLKDLIHHSPVERAHFQSLLALGLTDAFRLFEHPEKTFSWWDYRMLGFQKNRGLRIDHVLVSAPLVPLVRSCAIDRAPRKWPQPSDHAPVTVVMDA